MQPDVSDKPFVPMVIVVMGVSGSGKSTLGAMLATQLSCTFLEGDDFHDADAVAKMADGRPLSDDDRSPWLDRVGAAAAAAVGIDGRVVVACSALRRLYRDRLAAAVPAPTRFVLLDSNRAELARRLAGRAGHYMPASLIDSQLETLEHPGTDEPAITLDAGQSPDVLATAVRTWLGDPSAGGPI